MKRIGFFTIIISFFIFSCSNSPPSELTAEQKASIEKEVKERFNQLTSAVAELDVEQWSEYWSEKEFISVNSGVNYFSERSQFVDSVSYWFSERERQEVKPTRVDVTVLNSELVLLTSRIYWDVWLKSGMYLKFNSILTNLWFKEEDGWRIIQMHESWEVIE